MLSFVIVGLALIEFFDDSQVIVNFGFISVGLGIVMLIFGFMKYKKFKKKLSAV